jgi:hypothetical protein
VGVGRCGGVTPRKVRLIWGGSEVLVIESNQNHARAEDAEVCPCLPAAMGNGGGYVPMIVDVLPFDTTQITSDKNWSHPKYGDPCHPLASGQHPPTVVIHELSERDRMPESGSAPRLI